MKIVDSIKMHDLDSKCINEIGIPQEILMENAASSSLGVIKERYGDVANRNFLVICGTGNNGGDGLALARLLYSEGANISVYLLGDGEKYIEAAALNYKILKKMKIKFLEKTDLNLNLDKTEFIIDAIFGVGLNRPVEGRYKEIIEEINAAGKTVISLDIPSGINGSTGEIMDVAVKAECTVSYGFLKYGNVLYPAYDFNGKVYHRAISFPRELADEINTELNFPVKLPKRKNDSHKGDYGKTLFICGSANYLGAPYFSAMGFLKSGGGYSRLATSKSIIQSLAVNSPDIVYYPMEESDEGSIAYSNKDKLMNIIKDMKFVVIGCGVSLNHETKRLIKEIIKDVDIPMLIDADALTILSEDISIIRNKKFPVILTPHLGEMSSLCGKSINEIKKDSVNIIRAFSEENSCITVLKGAHSQLSFPDGDVRVNISGDSSLAVAGSGDLLCGIIAGQYALGYDLESSVKMGVFLHGLNGELSGLQCGKDGITTKTLLDSLPKTLKEYRINYKNISDYYLNIFK